MRICLASDLTLFVEDIYIQSEGIIHKVSLSSTRLYVEE